MKNNKISLIISLVALVGVILLFVANLSGTADKKDDTTTDVQTTNTSKYAFVNVDSALIYYDLYNTLSINLTQKQTDLEQQLQSKSLSLQNRMNQLQSKFSQHLITTAQYQQQGEALTNEQYSLQQWQQNKTLELQEDQMNLTQRVYDSIVSAVNILNADKSYDLIFSNSAGGTLLYGDTAMDITSEIVEILNNQAAKTPVTDTTVAN